MPCALRVQQAAAPWTFTRVRSNWCEADPQGVKQLVCVKQMHKVLARFGGELADLARFHARFVTVLARFGI